MRYVAIGTAPRYGVQFTLGETVHEQERAPVKTGLFDANGTPIYRVPDTQPLGFDIRPPKAPGSAD